MSERRTEETGQCRPELWHAICRSQSRAGDVDANVATLMRLADDPLRLSSFMARQPDEISGQRGCGGEMAAVCAAVPQRPSVSNWKRESAVDLRKYDCSDPADRTSLLPVRFVPDTGDAERALDGGFKSPPDAARTTDPLGVWSLRQGMMAVMMAAALSLLIFV